jgi:hypothetical protein
MTHKTIQQLEAEIAGLVAQVETADDPNVPFAKLRAALKEHIDRNRNLREEWYQQRNTIARQAARIADTELDALIGERAPVPGESAQPPSPQFPDVLTIDSAPNCLFLPLSYGYINLLHITELDLNARMMFTTHGSRNLSEADARKIAWYLKLYSPPEAMHPPTRINNG